MESKICSMCNFEKLIKECNKKFTECKDCKSKRGFGRYNENKDNISNQ